MLKIHGNRPIVQAEAAVRFIAAPEHEKMHDERLWDLRQKRDREMHGIAEWEELRSLASAVRVYTKTNILIIKSLFAGDSLLLIAPKWAFTDKALI